MQLVFEFGSKQLPPTVEAVRRVIGTLACNIECLPKGSDTNEPTDDSLESAAVKLEMGAISAFTVRPQGGPIRYALVLSPFFEGQPLSLYLGTIEYTGENYAPIWELLLGTSGLTVACLGYDEGVDLQDGQLTVETFPWKEWPLVIGALRDGSDSQSWIVREGPEIKRFSTRADSNGNNNNVANSYDSDESAAAANGSSARNIPVGKSLQRDYTRSLISVSHCGEVLPQTPPQATRVDLEASKLFATWGRRPRWLSPYKWLAPTSSVSAT